MPFRSRGAGIGRRRHRLHPGAGGDGTDLGRDRGSRQQHGVHPQPGSTRAMAPSEVARTTGLMLTIGYGAAFFGPALGGFAWDWSGQFRFALLPMALGALAMIGLGATLPRLSVSRPARLAESAAES